MKLSDLQKINSIVVRLKQNVADLERLGQWERERREYRECLGVAYIRFYQVADLNEDPVGPRYFSSEENSPRIWLDQSDHDEFSRKVAALMQEFLKREIHTCKLALAELGVSLDGDHESDQT